MSSTLLACTVSTMDASRALPPRRNLTPTRISKQYLSPLQILLQMGFQRYRAEKALAATGHRSAQLAADWLLAHVNDPTMDSSNPREYVVYACPAAGDFMTQLDAFWDNSYEECGWNEAHNYMPHITLVSYFKAPDECSLQLAQTLEQIAKQELESNKNSVDTIPFETYSSPNFIGLFVSDESTNILKQIAVQFVKEVSNNIINDNYEQLDAIATCFPWCTNAGNRFSLVRENEHEIPIKPNVKSPHLTLANQFDPSKFHKLKSMADNNLDLKSTCFWEIRLYSRDPRVRGKHVYKVIHSYSPAESDELELRSGDFIYVNDETNANSSDVWVEGISWLTGCSGFFPINYTQKCAETDSWTLHKSVPLFDRGQHSDVLDSDIQNTDDLSCNSDHLISDNASTVSMCSINVSDSETTKNKDAQYGIFVMRHGERVDFCFGNWIAQCISNNDEYHRKDLNMPVRIPNRENYPQAFQEDTPLTNVGTFEASLTGEGLKAKGNIIKHAFCSPALRCIQTCVGVLTGLGIANEMQIKVEAGLFEWMSWYADCIPKWMTNEELIAFGYKIDTSYKPFIDRDEIKTYVKENIKEYYKRHFDVIQHILETTGEKDTGNILVVGHASSVDTCSRLLCGKEARTEDEMMILMMKVPYCSMIKIHKENNQWKIVDSLVPGISHSLNKRFNWRTIDSEI